MPAAERNAQKIVNACGGFNVSASRIRREEFRGKNRFEDATPAFDTERVPRYLGARMTAQLRVADYSRDLMRAGVFLR
jgi:hypothetical protein